jgi:hypothetical protein
MKYYTDYDTGWDYELDERITKEHLILIKNIVKEIKKSIKHPIVKNIIVTPIILNNEGLGIYCYGTKQYIGIDVNNHLEYCKEYQMNLGLALKMTIVHEIIHAIQDSQGRELNEDEAENFARDFVDYGITILPLK